VRPRRLSAVSLGSIVWTGCGELRGRHQLVDHCNFFLKKKKRTLVRACQGNTFIPTSSLFIEPWSSCSISVCSGAAGRTTTTTERRRLLGSGSARTNYKSADLVLVQTPLVLFVNAQRVISCDCILLLQYVMRVGTTIIKLVACTPQIAGSLGLVVDVRAHVTHVNVSDV
jgi:hypothetical protein